MHDLTLLKEQPGGRERDSGSPLGNSTMGVERTAVFGQLTPQFTG